MKDKLIKTIREVPIADKTYTEYVEAVADKLIAEDYRKIFDDHQRQCTCYALGCQMSEQLKREVAREIFEEIEKARKKWDTVHNIDHYGYNGSAFGYLEADVDSTIYELKKKYTESEKDNG